VWKKETRAWGHVVEEEKLLLLANFAVIALRCLLEVLFVLFQLLLIGK